MTHSTGFGGDFCIVEAIAVSAMARIVYAVSILLLAAGLDASKDVHKLQIGVKVIPRSIEIIPYIKAAC